MNANAASPRAGHVPSTQPTPGPWYSPKNGTTIWSADGRILIATCASPQLCVAGNVANARLIVRSPALRDIVNRLLPFVDDAVDIWSVFPECAAGEQCRAAVAEARAILAAIDGVAAAPLKAAA